MDPDSVVDGSGIFIPDPESRIRLFSIPDPNFFHPGSWIHIKYFKYLTQTNFFKLS